ncbi:MAG: RNA polymerase sigma factor [bacterium]|nr:RNA polymerase sigma factor [bacterium]
MAMLEKKDSEFTKAYSLYYPVVFGSIYTKIGDTHTANDLAQEVFMRFFANQQTVEKPRPWLLGTVKNVLFEYYRKEYSMEEEVAHSEAYSDIALTFTNGFRDARILIDEAVESIFDPVNRSLFDLVAVYNFSYNKAGKQLGLSERQVKYRYGIIVKKVLEFLKEKGIENIEDLL